MIGLACLLFLDLAVARTFGTALTLGLVGLWLVLFLAACRQFMRRPWVVAALPVVGFAVWLAATLARG
jgi:hypothetical protein